MAPRESVDVLCVGHASFDQNVFVDGYPVENSKCEITQLLECGGGPAANAAYLLSFWGASSAFAGHGISIVNVRTPKHGDRRDRPEYIVASLGRWLGECNDEESTAVQSRLTVAAALREAALPALSTWN